MAKRRISPEELGVAERNIISAEELGIPRNANEVFRSRAQEAAKGIAETSTPFLDLGALLGRKNLASDLFRIGTFPIGEAVSAATGGESLPEQIVNGQTAPSIQPLKGADFGRIAPDAIQGALVEAGQAGGGVASSLAGAGPIPGMVAGGAAMSGPATNAAERMREFSPELFGENLESVKIGGVEIPTEEFNLMMDAGLPLLPMAARGMGQALKNKTARALVKVAGNEAPEELADAYKYLTNPSNEIDVSQIPDPTVASFGGPLEAIEQVSSIRGKQKVRDLNAARHQEFLKTQGGLSDRELQDMAIPKPQAEEVNALPFRKESVPIPTNRIPVDPQTARGVQILSRAGHVFNNLKGAADVRFDFVKNTLRAQGDTTIPLNEAVVSNLLDIHKGLEEIVAGSPELAALYGGPKKTIEDILNLPKTTQSVAKKGDKIVTTTRTVETPKKTTVTTGEETTKATPTGKLQESVSETVNAGEGNLLRRTTGSRETKNIPGATEEPVLTTAVDYNTLLNLNSALKRSISRGSIINPEEIPVVQTVEQLNKAIREGLNNKPNGSMLLKKHDEGFNLVTDRYRTFNPQMEKMLGGLPKEIFPKVLNDPNVANALVRATGSREVARKEAFAYLIDNSFDNAGNFDPRKALNTFNDSPGLNQLMTAKQKNDVKQFLTYSSGVTQDVSDIGKFSVAMRSGNLVVGLGAPLAAGAGLTGAATGAATLWFGGRHILSKILLDPEAAKIATRLVKTPSKSFRVSSDVRQLLRYLNGEKVIINVGNQSVETTVDSDLISNLRFARPQAPNSAHDLINRVQRVAQ